MNKPIVDLTLTRLRLNVILIVTKLTHVRIIILFRDTYYEE